MSVTVRVPTILRQYTGGVAEVVRRRARRSPRSWPRSRPTYPGIGPRVLDDEGKLRRFVNVYVGRRRRAVRRSGLDTPTPGRDVGLGHPGGRRRLRPDPSGSAAAGGASLRAQIRPRPGAIRAPDRSASWRRAPSSGSTARRATASSRSTTARTSSCTTAPSSPTATAASSRTSASSSRSRRARRALRPTSSASST